MLQVDLTTLSSPELRQLLSSTRERGQASLSYQILQEMAARRERGSAGLFAGRRPAEPRVIAVDLGDPLETPEASEATEEDDIPPLPPGWVPHPPTVQAEAAPVAAPPPAPTRRRRKTPPPAPPPKAARPKPRPPEPPPVVVARPRPEPELRPDLQSEPRPEPERVLQPDAFAPAFTPTPTVARASRFSHWSGLIFAAGVSLGVASGWWAGGVTRDLMHQDSSPKRVASAAATHVPAVAARVETAPAASSTAPAPALPPSEPLAQAAAVPVPEPPPLPVIVNQPVHTQARACAGAATPADRTICGHPHLQALQRDLRRAYAAALLAHQDRTLLRQRQLAWRETRNDVASPDRLARLYDDRIRQLRAAAADARRHARRA